MIVRAPSVRMLVSTPSPVSAWQRPADQLRGKARKRRPIDPILAPLALEIARPGNRAADAILPLRQHWRVVGTGQNGGGALLERRAIVAIQRRQALVELLKDRAGAGISGREWLFDQVVADSGGGLLHEDLRHILNVLDRVVAPAAGIGDLLQIIG